MCKLNLIIFDLKIINKPVVWELSSLSKLKKNYIFLFLYIVFINNNNKKSYDFYLFYIFK